MTVKEMWVSQDGNLSMGFALESTSSLNLCNLLLDGRQRGFAGIRLSVAPYFGYETEEQIQSFLCLSSLSLQECPVMA